jgi:dipeptidyl aminopeptidase/acylaminoacyl peptidase
VDKVIYRRDGSGYVQEGFAQLFIVPAEGGHPRQLTEGAFDHRGPLAWTADGQGIIFSANRRDDWAFQPRNSDVYRVDVADGTVRQLTDRDGPDDAPVISPDGKLIAYTGFDDDRKSYRVSNLYVMNADGAGARQITTNFDRNISNVQWSADSLGLYFLFAEEGNTKVGYTTLDGTVRTVARDVGGTSLGRPYGSGDFDVGAGDRFVFTRTRPERPADLATGSRESGETATITQLNEDLFAHKTLGTVEEFRAPSTFDGRNIQGWIVKPPNFDPMKKYPMILEIHGGPQSDYGDRFSAEIQLYAAAGYVVLYVNPRGSTSYGEVFANLIHHHYPGEDYDDLITMVDAVIARGYVNPEELFVTGGSGGGTLSAWIVGKTDRFAAAVVAKPVINWYSFILTADVYNYFYRYWFPGPPWEHEAHYMAHSPISLVGNVTTPTMLLTGERDYRTPISETEQYYQALKIVGADTVMVRIPEASHGIAARPSYLISKVAHVLAWFEKYRKDPGATGEVVTGG